LKRARRRKRRRKGMKVFTVEAMAVTYHPVRRWEGCGCLK
jgi:hypothetical protein